jgi:hypothetical protein
VTAAVPASPRVIAYFDGFNLFFGLKSKGWKQFYWLDVHAVARALLPDPVIKPDGFALQRPANWK